MLPKLDRDVRREFVGQLAESGMPTRAIAGVVGVDQSTVTRDLASDANASVEPEPSATDLKPVVGNPTGGDAAAGGTDVPPVKEFDTWSSTWLWIKTSDEVLIASLL